MPSSNHHANACDILDAKAEIPPEELSSAQAHTCADQVVTRLSARFQRPKVAPPQ